MSLDDDDDKTFLLKFRRSESILELSDAQIERLMRIILTPFQKDTTPTTFHYWNLRCILDWEDTFGTSKQRQKIRRILLENNFFEILERTWLGNESMKETVISLCWDFGDSDEDRRTLLNEEVLRKYFMSMLEESETCSQKLYIKVIGAIWGFLEYKGVLEFFSDKAELFARDAGENNYQRFGCLHLISSCESGAQNISKSDVLCKQLMAGNANNLMQDYFACHVLCNCLPFFEAEKKGDEVVDFVEKTLPRLDPDQLLQIEIANVYSWVTFDHFARLLFSLRLLALKSWPSEAFRTCFKTLDTLIFAPKKSRTRLFVCNGVAMLQYRSCGKSIN